MNKRKLTMLFTAARNEPAPVPPEDFAEDVLRAIRREPPVALPRVGSRFDQIDRVFPRLALAASAVIVLAVAVDLGLTAAGVPGLGDGLSQISAQWLLPTEAIGS